MRRTRRLLLAALALAVLAGAPPAGAGKPVGIAESFPTHCNVKTVAATADGGAWFACTETIRGRHGLPHARAKAGLVTAAGAVSEFAGPVSRETEPGRAGGAVTADGSFWFPVEESFEVLTHPTLFKAVPPSLARVTPTGEMTLFPVSGPITELAAVPDGSLRFKAAGGTGSTATVVWQVSPSGAITSTTADPTLPLGETATFPVQPVAKPGAIYGGSAIGADGNLWFGIQSNAAIGRLTPTGELTEFRECLRYGQPFFGPEALVRGVEGNIWFTSLAQRSLPNIVDPASIGMVTPAGAITQLYAGVTAEAKTISADSEGGVWFASGLEQVQRIKAPQGIVNTVHIGKLSGVKRGGSALLTVKVPSAGTLTAKPVAIVIGTHPKTAKRMTIRGGAAGATATNVCGSPQVRVHLTGEALQRLQTEGQVQIAIAVTFTPRGGHAYTEEKTFQFRLPRR